MQGGLLIKMSLQLRPHNTLSNILLANAVAANSAFIMIMEVDMMRKAYQG